MNNQRLIIIRGNSGSGKSTVAEKLRERIDGKVAIVGQDTLRRSILRESDHLEHTDIIGLLEQTVLYCLGKGYSVIIEGILSKPKYEKVLMKLVDAAKCDSYIYYIDVSLEETLKRHQSKSVSGEFGEKELRLWYQPKNYLDVPGEVIIHESSTLKHTVDSILNDIDL